MSNINRILALSGLAQNGINTNVRSAVSEAHSNELLKKVVDQIKQDADTQRFHEIDELLKDVPTEALQNYLSNADAERFLAGTDEDGEKITQAAKVEAVGDSAEPFYKLQDDFCGGESPSHAHRAFIDEIARWMTGDQVADFVEHIRRHYDMNDTEENVEEADSELSVMANSRDKVESTYAAIIKGDAEQTEVGDYIGHGMTKDQILKLIDMLEPQGYDKDFLLKDLAPMMEAGGDKVDNSELSRILKLSGLEVSEDQIDDEEVDEAQVTENKMSEKVTEIVDIIMKLAERETEQWADDPEMDGGDANYFMSVARELEGGDWDMARDAIVDGDTAPKEEVLSIIADNSPELLKALFPQDAEKEQYLATMRRESISEQLKDELINELMGD